MRVSGSKIVSVNVRVIAATNTNLTEAISNNHFRQDLYYRINTLPLEIPPLRERKEDLIYIINKYIKNKYKLEKKISNAVTECIMAYHWPGNVRELINTTEYIFYTSGSDTSVELCHLPEYIKNYYYNHIKNTSICDVFVGENAKNNLHTNVYDNEATCTLLIILIERKNIVSGMNSLRKEMLNKNCSITEGKLKKIIRNLRELKLVSVGATKQGTVITTEGEKYIKEVLHSRFR
jgi:transcriptional regulator with GAF, ATPase, and Fis domain